MSILFLAFHMLQSFVVRVTKAVNHYLNPPELRWMADSAPTQLKNLASGQTKSVSVPWQFAKHSGIPR